MMMMLSLFFHIFLSYLSFFILFSNQLSFHPPHTPLFSQAFSSVISSSIPEGHTVEVVPLHPFMINQKVLCSPVDYTLITITYTLLALSSHA